MKFRMMQKLVRALRSGRYEQGDSQLRKAGKTKKYAYCCLGVATRIARLAFDEDHWVKGTNEQMFLTERAKDYFGFFSSSGGTRSGDRIRTGDYSYTTLTDANDAGRTFDEIADAIKANWRDL